MSYKTSDFNYLMKPLKEEKNHSAEEMVVSVSTKALNMTHHENYLHPDIGE